MALPLSPEVEAGVTLANSILGVTIIALPYCFYECGVILATILLILVAMATVKSSELLLRAALNTGCSGYEQLGGQLFGRAGKLAVEFGLSGLSLGSLIAYFVIVGDLLPQSLHWLAPSDVADEAERQAARYRAMLLFAVFVALPLSLGSNVTLLAKASVMSMLLYAVMLMHLTTLATGSIVSELQKPSLHNPYATGIGLFRPAGLLFTVPILCLAFSCHTQLFMMVESLPNATLQQLMTVVRVAVYSTCVFYWLVGFLGCVAFHSSHPEVKGDMMAMYPDTVISSAMKLAFVAAIAVTFPVIVYPCRISLHSFVFESINVADTTANSTTAAIEDNCVDNEKAALSITQHNRIMPISRFRFITITIIAIALSASVLSNNVEFTLGLTGAVTGSLICYILPATLYVRACPGNRTAARALLLVGLLILAASGLTLLAVRPPDPAAAGGAAADPLAIAQRQQRQQLTEEKQQLELQRSARDAYSIATSSISNAAASAAVAHPLAAATAAAATATTAAASSTAVTASPAERTTASATAAASSSAAAEAYPTAQTIR